MEGASVASVLRPDDAGEREDKRLAASSLRSSDKGLECVIRRMARDCEGIRRIELEPRN